MHLYCRGRALENTAVRLGINTIKEALGHRGIPVSEESLSMAGPNETLMGLAVRICLSEGCSQEGFAVERNGEFVTLTGYGTTGTMYGLFDLAETIRLYGWDKIVPMERQPFHKKRGIKFNLPFQPYAEGDIFRKNRDTVRDTAFWQTYLEFLAKSRYNCLSLWSENPFEYMVDIAKYPEASGVCPEERRKMRELFSEVFAYARELGIDIYIITWNLRISPGIAKGLGLPEELSRYNHHSRSIGLRQHNEVIRDYFKEAVKALVQTYPDLTGIGTSNSEELTGTPEAREQWVVDTYLQGLKELGYPIPFIHRTNMSNGVIAQDMFLSQYDAAEKYVSWKYSNAHMYSHASPQFEHIFNAWGEMEMDGFRVLYTVRNDDFHNLRGCDPDFIRAYITGMKKPYADGFYWGADGYVWAGEHQHVPNHPHVEWKYAFQKHWMQFDIIGRLAYDPTLPTSLWEDKFVLLYGRLSGAPLFRGLCAGVRLLCAVNRIYWLNYDFQWHPESLLGREGFKTINDFMSGIPMPDVDVMGMREFARCGPKAAGGRETPEDILSIIEAELLVIAGAIEDIQENGKPAGEVECIFWDVKAWYALGSYYLRKIKAAVELLCFEISGEAARKNTAVALLEEALAYWSDLSCIGSQHYLPYAMARVEQTFGWSICLREVEQDIARAKAVRPIGPGHSGSKEYRPGEWSGF